MIVQPQQEMYSENIFQGVNVIKLKMRYLEDEIMKTVDCDQQFDQQQIINVTEENQKESIRDFFTNNDKNQFIFAVELNEIQFKFIKYISDERIIEHSNEFCMLMQGMQNMKINPNKKFDLFCLAKKSNSLNLAKKSNSLNYLIIKFLKKNENQTDESLLEDISKVKFYNIIFSIIYEALNLQDPKTVKTQIKLDIFQLFCKHMSKHIYKLLNLIIRIHNNLYPEDNIKLEKYEDMLKKYEVIQLNEKSKQDELFEKLNQYSVENFDESDLAVLVEKLNKTVELIQSKEQNSNSANKV